MKHKFKNNIILFLFFASSLIVLAISISSAIIMQDSAHMIEQMSQDKLVALSKAAAMLTTADELDSYTVPEDMNKESYAQLNERLASFSNEAELEYTYYLRLDKSTNQMQFIIDNSKKPFTGLEIPQVDREPTPDIALTGKAQAVPLGSYSNGWQGYTTAFAPVYYSDGRLSDIVAGVDMYDTYIKAAHSSNRLLSAILIASILFVLATSFVCLLLYKRKASLSELASVSKSMFLSNMSHEMRTPLNAIMGMNEIAKKTDELERIRYCQDKITGAADHLLGVINDILDISKIEAGKYTLSETAFFVRDMLDKVLNVVSFRMDEKAQVFTIDVDDGVPEALFTDRQRLMQVITNLLSNAMKFTPEGGSITLKIAKARETDDALVIRFDIADTGIGIPPEQQSSLFESFVQADGSISRKFGGTGLGLAISKNIVEMMDGEIWVESEPGKGAVFSFTVRTQKAALANGASVQADESAEQSEYNFSGKHILLAEDVEINREIVLALLEDTGAAFDCAETGTQACDMFLEEPDKYDLFLMDIQLPGMDGYEATRKIRANEGENTKSVPIIAMTANVFREDIDRCTASGMNGHIGKPIVTEEVLLTLNKHLHPGSKV